MLELWDPWPDFERLRGEVDRLFGRYAGADQGGRGDVAVRPAARLRETEDAYRLSVDLPGVPAEAVELETQGRALRLRAERRDDGDGVRRRYERLMMLPESADPSAIEARHADGVLDLVVPKRREALPRRVEILAGDADDVDRIESGERTAIGAPA